MNYGDYRRLRQPKQPARITEPIEHQRLLNTIHLKTIENRTLLETLKNQLTAEKLDEIIVDYAIRLRKARKNFERQNLRKELDFLAYEAELGDTDSEITAKP